MDILLCKLTTGEEVMGEVDNVDTSGIRLKNPVRVAVMRGQDGQPNVGFAPFPQFAPEKKDSTIDFLHHHVVYYYTPAEEFCKNYEQMFGLGLILPGEKKIITG